jgi:hypothetical protein
MQRQLQYFVALFFTRPPQTKHGGFGGKTGFGFGIRRPSLTCR